VEGGYVWGVDEGGVRRGRCVWGVWGGVGGVVGMGVGVGSGGREEFSMHVAVIASVSL